MSGFVALLNLDGTPLDPATDLVWLQAATEALAFCGPDAQHCWHAGPVGFGHTLLRTTFEAAHEQQPCTLDGEVWLTADARIDDRPRLLASLRSHGRTLDTDAPDPLLILHAYAVWGEAFLDHLLGDFALVLWDGRAQKLICARDHVGAVPCFYARVGDRLVLSNSLTVVRSHPGVAHALDEVAVVDFLLTNHYVDAEATIFAAIRRVPPAHTLVADAQQTRVVRYWQPPEQVEYIRYRQPQEYVEHFRHLFDQAVSDRLRTDCVGSDLSGGLDSTSIAVTANRLLRAQGKPYTMRGATTVYAWLIEEEEGKYAQQVADFAGFSTTRYVCEEYLARVPEATHAEPEPWALNALWSNLDILRDTAQFGRVYFLGFGGDPLLGWARVPWRAALGLGQMRSVARDARQWWRARWPRPHPYAAIFKENVRVQQSLIAPTLAARVDPAARHTEYFARYHGGDQRRGMFEVPLWETIFRVNHPSHTKLPVKVRLPFFDLRLIDFLMRVPPDPWCLNKYLLREAMMGQLPETVRRRPKTPLGPFPVYKWVQNQGVPTWMHELTALPALDEFVNREALTALFANPTQLTSGNWRSIYVLLTFAHWLRHGKIG